MVNQPTVTYTLPVHTQPIILLPLSPADKPTEPDTDNLGTFSTTSNLYLRPLHPIRGGCYCWTPNNSNSNRLRNESKGVNFLDDALYDSCDQPSAKMKSSPRGMGFVFLDKSFIYLRSTVHDWPTSEVGCFHVRRQLTFPLVAPVLEPDFNLKTVS